MKLAVLLFLIPGVAMAQATANPSALDSLKPNQPAPRHASRPPVTPSRPSAPNPATRPAPARQSLPTVPTTPPPIASLPPPTPVPVRPTTPPIIPIAADAPGSTSPLPSGLRVTFGADRSDLSPATVEALRQYAATLGGSESTTVTLMAYAAGVAEDPSTPRRLSLARALAARAVLLDAGVASTRIYPRAMGPAPEASTDAPPDRVDLTRYPPASVPQSEAAHVEPSRAEAARTVPARAEPARAEPARPAPASPARAR